MFEQIPIFDIKEGRLLRDEALEALAGMADSEFVDIARNYAKAYARKHGQVTSDDVRRWANIIGLEPDSPKQWGCLFMGKEWYKVGYTQTAIKSSHARPIGVWRLAE